MWAQSGTVGASDTASGVASGPAPGAPGDGAPVLPTTDDELVPRLRRGDGEAFRLLVERYGDDLFRMARSVMDNEADGYDLVQQTLVGAFERVGAFDGR